MAASTMTAMSLKPVQLSSRSAAAGAPLRMAAPAAPAAAARKVTVCSADAAKKATVAISAAIIAATASGAVAPADVYADVAGLTPCSESKAFAKRKNTQIKGFQKRMAKYEEGSAPALALQASIDKTERRFANYAKSGVLCGSDGLPHLIVDGDLNHLGEFVIPGLAFLYTAGWIGWVGREYIIAIRDGEKPTEKEIIIDVPLALKQMRKGLTWPVAAYESLRNGSLLEKEENITVSPR